MEGSDSEFVKFTLPTLKAFLEALSQIVSGKKQQLVADAIGCPKPIFSPNSRFSGQLKNDVKTLFSTLYHLSPIIFAPATVVAFVLLHSFRLNFHCYTQHEPKAYSEISLEVTAATFCNFLCERLRRAFTRAHQLHWAARYANKKHKFSKHEFLQYCPR